MLSRFTDSKKESSGVGRRDSNRYVLIPVCIQAECCFPCANSGDILLESCDGYAFFLSVLGNDVAGKALGCLAYGGMSCGWYPPDDTPRESAAYRTQVDGRNGLRDFCPFLRSAFSLPLDALIKIWIIAPFFIYFSVTLPFVIPPCLFYFYLTLRQQTFSGFKLRFITA